LDFELIMATVAKVQKPKRHREWVPSALLIVHDRNVSCTIRFTPMHLRRNPDARYYSSLKVYGNNALQPVWQAESGALPLHSVYNIESGAIARDMGVERLFHYGEAFNWSPDFDPPDPNIAMQSHVHYQSTDGSFQGHLASFFIFGAPRRIERGEFHYESFPAARVDGDVYCSVYVINPFVRPSGFWVKLVTADGETIESERMTVRGKGVATWSGEKIDLPAGKNPVGVIVRSEAKTTSFFTTRMRDGRMIGLDHGHPFLCQVLNHVRPVTVTAV
jgi:hypothetical protein